MNRSAFAVLLVLTAACASTPEKSKEEQLKEAQAQFDHIKSLAGTWSGRAAHGDAESSRVDVNYKVTAGGSAVLEMLFPDTEHEMLTVYYLDGDKLMLTHYCAMGNQPSMVAVPFNAPTTGSLVIDFDFAHGTNMDAEKDSHMHSAEIEFLNKDHIETKWAMFKDSKQVSEASFDLVRQEAH
jgi:hypothetical protein